MGTGQCGKPRPAGAGVWWVPALGAGVSGPAGGSGAAGKVCFSEQLKCLGGRFCFGTGAGTTKSSDSMKG